MIFVEQRYRNIERRTVPYRIKNLIIRIIFTQIITLNTYIVDMDPLSSILEFTKLKGLVCDTLSAKGSWGLEMGRNETVQFWRLIKGACLVGLYDGPIVAMKEGDIVIIPHGAAHWLGDHEESVRVTQDAFVKSKDTGVNVFANSGMETIMVGGYFTFDQQQIHPFFKNLPQIIQISQFGSQYQQILEHTAGLMFAEIKDERPGKNMMRKSLAELLFVTVIRAYLEQACPKQGFLAALNDGQISAALKLMHNTPEQLWTLELLAREVGMSRSVFAARFKKLIGETPLTYLTNWRISKACEILTNEKITIDEVAYRVGYQSEPAFNRIFKAKMGNTPAVYRKYRKSESV